MKIPQKRERPKTKEVTIDKHSEAQASQSEESARYQ
jgi:hypothetical protein